MVVISLFNLLDFESLYPRIKQRFLARTLVFDVALTANEAPHFLPGGIDIRIIIAFAVAFPPSFDAWQMGHAIVALREIRDTDDEARPRHANLHRFRIMAVDATNRMCRDSSRCRSSVRICLL